VQFYAKCAVLIPVCASSNCTFVSGANSLLDGFGGKEGRGKEGIGKGRVRKVGEERKGKAGEQTGRIQRVGKGERREWEGK